MQNHTNYNKDNYPDDQRVKVTEAPAGLKASTVGALEDFATGIRDADAMLGRLTDYFSQVDEPVILVFWGDHYNPIDSNYDIYTRSGYASGSSADPRLHQTTLLMWSNYSDRAVDLGTTRNVSLLQLKKSQLNRFWFVVYTFFLKNQTG